MNEDWFWEGNVVESVCVYLQNEGWVIEQRANTKTKEAGVDIQAKKNDKILLVEVKGYPTTTIQWGIKKGQPKSTRPNTQARHWYSEVLLTAILRQEQEPEATVVIAFPEFTVFTNLVQRTQNALAKLGIDVYFVKDSGLVEVFKPVPTK